ncbi:FAR1 DNA binding domain-containing protein [Artemisia annua]|uniref:FAR1 DNA binding domain-containing protein n=1 Tax=Artemisia annua TaxID=35608 RepID=A0A2U1M7R1_ARTAN|nr:FAR1 DNA binding domain-containing protein [Artemisia annua]
MCVQVVSQMGYGILANYGIHYIRQDDSDICEEIELADGSFHYKPIVEDFDRPKIGNKYRTLDDCIRMYEEYAEKAGFSIRLSTQNFLKSGVVDRKYLVCNREGLAKGVNKDTMNEETSETQIRTSSISRTGCMAKVKFKLNESHTEYELEGLAKGVNKDTMNEETSETQIRTSSISRTGCMAKVKFELNESHTEYELYDFVEEHNHTFVPELAAAAGSPYVRDMMIVSFEREVDVLLLDEADLRKKAQEIRSRVAERDMVVGELEKLFAFDSTLQSISELSKLQTQELKESAEILVNVMKKQTRATELLAVIKNLKALPY